jgi:hypothetical protein
MRSIPICISRTAFLVEMLELHRWNTSVGFQISGNQTDVSGVVHRSLTETGAFRPRAGIDRGRCRLQNQEELTDVIRDNPSTDILQVAYQVGLSRNAVWPTLHADQFYKNLYLATFTYSCFDDFYRDPWM